MQNIMHKIIMLNFQDATLTTSSIFFKIIHESLNNEVLCKKLCTAQCMGVSAIEDQHQIQKINLQNKQ